MKLDRLLLIIVVIAAALYFTAMAVGAIILTPTGVGIPMLIVLGVGAYVIWRVIADRRANAEDDYYDKNVEK